MNQVEYKLNGNTGHDANKHDTICYIPYIFKPLCLVKLFLYFSCKRCPDRLRLPTLDAALSQRTIKPSEMM
jgi:hypothetical protein